MAHGAPDHTRLTESGFAHYKDIVVLETVMQAIPVDPGWKEIVNRNIKGVWGYMWFYSDSQHLKVRVTIDGVVVFIAEIADLVLYGFWGVNNPWRKMGCSRFDTTALAEQYALFYDEEWGLYIHKSLKVEAQRRLATGTKARWGIYYKELV